MVGLPAVETMAEHHGKLGYMSYLSNVQSSTGDRLPFQSIRLQYIVVIQCCRYRTTQMIHTKDSPEAPWP